jgi:hypothetical protein
MSTLDIPERAPAKPTLEIHLGLPQYGLTEPLTVFGVIQSSLVWGYISAISRRMATAEGEATLGGIQSGRPISQWHEIFARLDESYRQFLSRSYGSVGARLILSLSTYPQIALDPEAFANEYPRWVQLGIRSPDLLLRTALDDRSFNGSSFDYEDFRRWIAEVYGDGLLELEKLSTTESIEVAANLAQFVAVFALQQLPLYKDCLVLSLDLIKRYLGTGQSDINRIGPNPPAHVVRAMAKYNYAEYEHRDGKVRLVLDNLRRPRLRRRRA